jgi:amidase
MDRNGQDRRDGQNGESGYDLLITPTLRQPAWPLGQNGGAADSGVFPFPFSLTGQPALSLPLSWTDHSLPVGVQVVAAHGREDVLIRVGTQLEQAIPWADRWPPSILSQTVEEP